MVLIFLLVVVGTPSLNAQSVHIGDAGAIPNGGVIPPTVLESTFAPYTEEASAHGIEGTVTIEAVIGEYGQIRNARILRGLGFGLDEIALASVQEWLLSPATRDGVPISVVAQIDVPFRMRSANAFRIWQSWRRQLSAPTVLSRIDPQYREEARRARLEGIVVLEAIIKNDGTVDAIRVVQGLAFGLTDSAVEALKQWKFSPGKKDGHDADVASDIVINFNLR